MSVFAGSRIVLLDNQGWWCGGEDMYIAEGMTQIANSSIPHNHQHVALVL
jgi:hypothetical protein